MIHREGKMEISAQVRWGIVGTGAMAELFAQALARVKGAVLYGVSSRRSESADAFAARFGFSHSYRSSDELVQDPAIDIVYVATRNQYHREDSLAAINSDKAVLCEKPFALSAAEGRDIVEAARRRSVFCMEAMWMRFSPAVREVIDTVRSGGLGTPVFLSAQLGFPIEFDPLHRVFVRPGGGALFDLGVYPLSFAHALLGPPIQIKSVACIGPTDVDDQVTAVLGYKSGCQAVVAASLRTRLANAAAIHGSDGILDSVEPLYFPDRYRLLKRIVHTPAKIRPQNRLSSLPQRVWARLVRGLQGDAPAGKVMRHCVADGYACEAAAVQRCLQKGLLESPEMPLDESLDVLESMDDIRSQWSGKT